MLKKRVLKHTSLFATATLWTSKMSAFLLLGMIACVPISFVQAQDQFIVWNIGQGQWTTEVHQNRCLHFDLGGEKDVSFEVLKYCSGKMNFLHLSHWDWDHLSYAAHFAALSHSACIVHFPAGSSSSHKFKMISKIPLCTANQMLFLKADYTDIYSPQKAIHKNDTNELSEVAYSKEFHILIPGDSPKNEERIWAEESPRMTEGLILGHHGSRTSSSENLLHQLPHLKWAVASARKLRYGHPHAEVVERLKKDQVPLLKTEDWGHLHFLKNHI